MLTELTLTLPFSAKQISVDYERKNSLSVLQLSYPNGSYTLLKILPKFYPYILSVVH